MRLVPREGVLGLSLPFHLAFDWHLPTTPHQGYLMATQEDYLEQKSYALGNTKYRLLEHTATSKRNHDFRVVTRKTMVVVLPDWARPFFFIRPKNTITQTEAWRPATADGTRVIDIRVQVRGVPVKVWGTGTLSPVGIGHRLDIVMTVISWAPVIGSRLAEFVASQVELNMQGEGDFAVHWVESHEEYEELWNRPR